MGRYNDIATGDLEKARQAYELWADAYPRDQVPRSNLGVIYRKLGDMKTPLRNFARPSSSTRKAV